MWPLKPGSINPAVECVNRPRRPREDFPSKRPAMSSGRVMTSYVLAKTNSPGCKMKGSSPSAITSRVKSGCSIDGSITLYLWFSKTRKNLSRRTSTEDGWIMDSVKGSQPTRPAAISARISRSLSSTLGTLSLSRAHAGQRNRRGPFGLHKLLTSSKITP